MPTVYLDRIENSSVERDQQGIARAVRKCIVDGLDVTGVGDGSDVFALVKASVAGGLPQLGEQYPADPACKLTRHIIRGMANAQAEVQCIYERPTFSGVYTIGAWLLTSKTTTVPIRTQLVPGTATPIRVKWHNATSNKDIIKTATTIIDVDCCRVTAIGQFYGLGTGGPWRLGVGSVNQGGWLDRPEAYWKFDDLTDEPIQIDYANSNNTLYKYCATFTTKIVEDWATYQIMQLPNGDFVQLNPQTVAAARNSPYSGLRTVEYDGITRIEPYRLTDFRALLGIS